MRFIVQKTPFEPLLPQTYHISFSLVPIQSCLYEYQENCACLCRWNAEDVKMWFRQQRKENFFFFCFFFLRQFSSSGIACVSQRIFCKLSLFYIFSFFWLLLLLFSTSYRILFSALCFPMLASTIFVWSLWYIKNLILKILSERGRKKMFKLSLSRNEMRSKEGLEIEIMSVYYLLCLLWWWGWSRFMIMKLIIKSFGIMKVYGMTGFGGKPKLA